MPELPTDWVVWPIPPRELPPDEGQAKARDPDRAHRSAVLRQDSRNYQEPERCRGGSASCGDDANGRQTQHHLDHAEQTAAGRWQQDVGAQAGSNTDGHRQAQHKQDQRDALTGLRVERRVPYSKSTICLIT
jgi:hypothetical protein